MATLENVDLIELNFLALHNSETADDWFDSLEDSKKTAVLGELSTIAVQAGASTDDVDQAIKLAKLRRTFTPCVLLAKGRLRIQISKVLELPNSERLKSFRLLLALYGMGAALLGSLL